VAAARVRPVHLHGRIPSASGRGGRVLLVAERLVQLGRVVQQALHEDLFLRIVAPVRGARAAAAAASVAQLSRAGPAARQRSVPVVRAHRQVLGAPAQHAHDVRALERRRRLFQPVQRADRTARLVSRVRLHVEALAPEQRRF